MNALYYVLFSTLCGMPFAVALSTVMEQSVKGKITAVMFGAAIVNIIGLMLGVIKPILIAGVNL